jgi:hypothetical protein
MIKTVWLWRYDNREYDISIAFLTRDGLYFGITCDGNVIMDNQKYLDRVYDMHNWDYDTKMWTEIFND